MPKQIVFPIVTFLHDLFTAIWVGGLITLGVTVLPSAKKVLGMGPETKRLMDAIQRRLSILIYISIAGLILTGLLLSNRSPSFQGLFHFGDVYSTLLSVKHILVLVMIAVALYRSLVLGRSRKPLGPTQEKVKAGLLFLNIGLGIGVLLLSAICAALSAGVSLT
ncbi:MAG TPA: hypothetical protein G4O00_14960 [Thermoflexia bacterium]|nr:hypothetical protein [Thermoflexia bacterium]